jgi:hypothetical protein
MEYEIGMECDTHGREEVCIRILLGNPEGKRPFGRHRRRCENNIRMNLREMGWGVMDWIDLAQNRDQWWAPANTVIKLRVP